MTAPDLASRLDRREPVPVEDWTAFWARVEDPTSDPEELVAVLTSASALLPRDETLVSFVRALAASPGSVRIPAVDIVGIGGGPSTMNLSTAAAIVAASAGASVVKTGSRGYTSSLGSTEFLGRAGIATSTSLSHLERQLRDEGIALAGFHVYPPQLMKLARRIVPVGLREFGGFLNVVGPFLSRPPVAARVVGRSDRAPESALRSLGEIDPGGAQWICSSAIGADELISAVPSRLVHPDGSVQEVIPGDVVSGAGSIDDLRAVEPHSAVDHFRQAISGLSGTAVTETIALNAGAVVLASGIEHTLASAVARARAAIDVGAATSLMDRLRAPAPVGGVRSV